MLVHIKASWVLLTAVICVQQVYSWPADLAIRDDQNRELLDCEDDDDCRRETQCCGATFGVRMCKYRPTGGQQCDPHADNGCGGPVVPNFCECPCIDGFECRPVNGNSPLFICQPAREELEDGGKEANDSSEEESMQKESFEHEEKDKEEEEEEEKKEEEENNQEEEEGRSERNEVEEKDCERMEEEENYKDEKNEKDEQKGTDEEG